MSKFISLTRDKKSSTRTLLGYTKRLYCKNLWISKHDFVSDEINLQLSGKTTTYKRNSRLLIKTHLCIFE